MKIARSCWAIIAIACILAMPATVLAHGHNVEISTPNYSSDKAPANTPITITLNTYPCMLECSNPGGLQDNQSREVRWSVVDGNGNWVNPQTVQMTLVEQSNGPDCSGVRRKYQATIPGQPVFTRVEFVIHSYGPNGDFWYKSLGKLLGSWPSVAPGCGYDQQAGWPRIFGSSGGSNFYYITLETPFVVIDFPQENEVITSTQYEIRMGANASTNNVKIKIDSGNWSQCYQSGGYWWFHWEFYPNGPHEIIAEAWNELGQRSETGIRHCTANY